MSGDSLINLLFILPLLASILAYFLTGMQRTVVLSALVLHMLTSSALAVSTLSEGPIATSAGGWLAPFGIVLIVDSFAVLMLVAMSAVFICSLLTYRPRKPSVTYPLLLLLQAGVSLSFITGDLFNLFVAFELMLVSSYALFASEARDGERGLYAYALTNVCASLLFLIGIAAIYGHTGTLNFALLSQRFADSGGHILLASVGILCLVMLIKGAVFPFYFWLPDSYSSLPFELCALFGGVLSKVGIYALYRLLLTLFPAQGDVLMLPLLILGCASMFFGVMGAVSRQTIQGILSYHILSQVGYIVFALSIGTAASITAGVFFILHNMIVKSSLILLGGAANRACGTSQLKTMGGLWLAQPLLGFLFFIQAMALAGIPPLSGFWGKYLIFFEGVGMEFYLAVLVAVVTSFFTLMSMVKIWNGAFLQPAEAPPTALTARAYIGPSLLTAIALGMGLFAQPCLDQCKSAAHQLMDPTSYVSTALSSGYKGGES